MKELTDREKIVKYTDSYKNMETIGKVASDITKLSSSFDGSEHEKGQMINLIAELMYQAEIYFDEEYFSLIPYLVMLEKGYTLRVIDLLKREIDEAVSRFKQELLDDKAYEWNKLR